MKKKYIIIICLILLFFVIFYNIFKNKKSIVIKELCTKINVFMYSMKDSIINAFDPNSSIDDVYITINKQTFLLLPSSIFTMSLPTHTQNSGFSYDLVISIVNDKSIWDDIWFSNGQDNSKLFHIFGTENKFIVFSYVGSPICENNWVKLHNINLTNFNLQFLSSTLKIDLDNIPRCYQIDNQSLHLTWKFNIESSPILNSLLKCDADLWSGYCGISSSFKCLHSIKNTPCPNQKTKWDSGTIISKIVITLKILFSMTLDFDVNIDIARKIIKIHKFHINLDGWNLEKNIKFQTDYTGFKIVSIFTSLDKLIDTSYLEKLVNTQTDDILKEWIPKLFYEMDLKLRDVVLEVPL